MLAKRLMLAAGLSLCVAGLGTGAVAQTVAPAAKKQTATGVKSFEAGARAFESGKFSTAIQSLSAALSAGGLSSQQMAKALYYRGAAYRKEGKTAQAISDLTSSVWLKNGLSDTDRAAAMDQRQQAYRDAGLGDAVPIGAAPLDAPQTAATAPAPAPAAAAAVASAETAASSWAVSTSDKSAAEASVPAIPASNSLSAAVSAPVLGGLSTTPADAPTLSALPQGTTTPGTEVAAPSLQGVGSAIGNAGSAVGNFFGNIFSSGGAAAGAQATSEPSSGVATASTGGWDAAPAAAPAATADWNAATSVAEGKASRPVQTAALNPAKPVSVPVAAEQAASGKYRLQVGVLRSRAEAEQMAAKLRQSHGAKLGSAAPAIDEVVYGNMGTFYRVQVGPYASAAEPGKFCDSLKPQGYDCLVVTK